jgi:hypothetical protein
MNGRPHEVEAWLARCDPDQRAQVESLIDLVHDANEDIDEAIRWRRLTFTVGGNWHHWLCAITVTKQGASLMFHKGTLLDDPAGALQGNGRYLRHVPYARAAAARDIVATLVRQAVVRQTDMLDETG